MELKVNVNGHQMGPMFFGDGMNLLSEWFLKPCTFSQTHSQHKRKTLKKFFSARATVVHVFAILNVRWRGLLTMLVTNRENVSNTIIICFVSYDFG